MKKFLVLLLGIMFVASAALAQQQGTVSGTVVDDANNPVAGATIHLNSGGGHPGDPHHDYHTLSATDGTFSLINVEAGHYIATASKMMVGRDVDSVDVVAGQNTVINFVLTSDQNPPVEGTGSVSGTVTDTLGNPIAGAQVHIVSPARDRHHPEGRGHQYRAETDSTGAFFFDEVAAGEYMATAGMRMEGHDSQNIIVIADSNTVVNFVLEYGNGHRHGGGGEHRGDSLEVVTITGWAIVIQDSLRTEYFLDVNGNDTADFRLLFGPPWYEPNSGAVRPNDGDSIWVTGGLLGYGDPQAVVVYEINGLFWRTPGVGHGGHGGHGGGYPHPDSLETIEVAGVAMVDTTHRMDQYRIDTDGDDLANYILNFGPPDYDPGNGATRPADGDSISIVGGLLDGRDDCLDMIIVYEINGQEWWRTPGDTTLLWQGVTSVSDPTETQLPTAYLTANSYPNPFNAQTLISFELREASHVRITVYDILGQQIAVLANQDYPAGSNQVVFDMNNTNSSSAVYFYRVEAGQYSTTGKMTLLK